MNILFICDEYPPGKNGGIGSAVKSLADKLSEQNNHVYVIGLYPHGYGGLDYEEQGEVKIWRLRYKTDIGLISDKNSLKDKVIINLLRKLGILNIDANYRLKNMINFIKEIIQKYAIHIIEIPDWNNIYFNLNTANFKLPDFGIPLNVKLHGTHSYFNHEQGLNISKKIFTKESYLITRADSICSVSNYTADYCRKLYDIKKNIEVTYNGVDVRPYVDIESRSNTNRVLFSGSLLYKKGIYSLVQAWKSVLDSLPNATLHVYGKGNQLPLLNLLDDKTKKSVFFYGHVTKEHLFRQLENCDLAVFPSYTETFGLAALEAMSLGCPTIYTKKSCGPEIIDDNLNGVLVNPDDISEISHSIVRLLGNNLMRKKLSLAAYNKVSQKFNIDVIASQHKLYYEKVIDDYNNRH